MVDELMPVVVPGFMCVDFIAGWVAGAVLVAWGAAVSAGAAVSDCAKATAGASSEAATMPGMISVERMLKSPE